MKTLAFFNNKGGVGKTTLVYHLAWMFAELGLSVLAADLDPQANLTSMFLSEDELEDIWEEDRFLSNRDGMPRAVDGGNWRYRQAIYRPDYSSDRFDRWRSEPLISGR